MCHYGYSLQGFLPFHIKKVARCNLFEWLILKLFLFADKKKHQESCPKAIIIDSPLKKEKRKKELWVPLIQLLLHAHFNTPEQFLEFYSRFRNAKKGEKKNCKTGVNLIVYIPTLAMRLKCILRMWWVLINGDTLCVLFLHGLIFYEFVSL